MSRYESVADLHDKIEWEGGLLDAIHGYGIHEENLPSTTPRKVTEAWGRLDNMHDDIAFVEEWLETNSDEGREYVDLSDPMGQ